MVLDQASFHRTKKMPGLLRDKHTVPCVVPSGCTSLAQPLDTHINKSFKVLLKEEAERLTEEFDAEMAASGRAVDIEEWQWPYKLPHLASRRFEGSVSRPGPPIDRK